MYGCVSVYNSHLTASLLEFERDVLCDMQSSLTILYGGISACLLRFTYIVSVTVYAKYICHLYIYSAV